MMRLLTLILPLAAVLCGTAALPPAPEGDSPRARSLQRLVARADSGVAQAQFALSGLIERGEEGFARDSVLALRLLRMSAGQGYAPACNYLGYCYFIPSLGLRQDADSALAWIERAASVPDPDPKAFNNLGMLLLTGEGGVRRDYGKAFYWLSKGACRGVPAAQASLAHMSLEGLGVEKDSLRAGILLHDAAAAGLRQAAVRLREITAAATDTMRTETLMPLALGYYHEGLFDLSAPLFEQCAGRGDAYAAALLAQSYARGLGVPYSYERSVEWYKKAAEGGDPSAQYVLGETLSQFPDMLGEGPTAQEWLERAATGGVTDGEAAMRRLNP